MPDVDQVAYEEACTASDIVIMAIPYTAVADTLPQLADPIGDKVLVDATNPLNDDWTPLPLDGGLSAGEVIARLAPRARVVKTFNTVFADVMTQAGLDRHGMRATAFIAGDDDDAVDLIAQIASEIGLAPRRTGPLINARHLEGMAHLNIAIALGQGGGTDAAFVYG